MERTDVRPKVLAVDDEPAILDGLRLILRKPYCFFTAPGATEALHVLETEGPFTVIISDLRMPGIDGIQFLRRARERFPETVRMLLTGQADFESAIRAVNEGFVFRFLLKPCPDKALRAAVDDAVEQYRLVTADKVLLEQKVQAISAQMLQAERLATLGTLAGGVGHELNNVLTVLNLVLHSMHAGAPLQDGQLAMLHKVADHVRMHAKHLLNLGRPRVDAPIRVDLREVLEGTLQLLATVQRTHRTQVSTDLGDVPLWVIASRTHLEQIVMNLVGNAVDAMADKPLEDRHLRVWLERSPDGLATCRIEDSGSGIPADKLDAIFQPYYTTKPPDRGTGLGLPVVRQLVEGAGGSLSVSSVVGQGSVFSFSLPLDEPLRRLAG